MLKTLFLIVLFFVGSIAFGQETGNRLLVPRADSPTAMNKCGAVLEDVKAQSGLMRRYVFTGSEILTQMQYCVVEGGGAVRIANTSYRVPAGSIGWTNESGTEVVLEECVNKAVCDRCNPPTPPQPRAGLPPINVPEVGRITTPPGNFGLPPWNPRPPAPAPAPPPPPVHECPTCAAILSSASISEMGPKSKPVEVWPEIVGGTVTDGVWTFNGKVIGRGPRLTINHKMLKKAAGKSKGTFYLKFVGKDDKGDIITCGLEGLPIKLEKKGRHWIFYFPVIHCLYAYTAAIKDWTGWDLVEKTVFCPGEVFLGWYYWPVGGVKVFKPTMKPGGAGILPGFTG